MTPTKRIFRFLPFHHAVQFLKTGELSFSRPSSWDDPYEKDYDTMGDRDVYAQCWTSAFNSEAMWRIYSPNRLGVRIRTTHIKMDEELKYFIDYYKIHAAAKFVEYCKHNEFREKQNNTRVTQKVFIKRNAFDHEKEFRIVLAVGRTNNKIERKEGRIILKIKSKPTEFVDLVMLDPGAPKELVAALKLYFSDEFGDSLKCIQSSLYKYDKDSEDD